MGSAGNQLNIEFFFRILYDCLHGSCTGSVEGAQFSAFLAHTWIWITTVGYILAVLGLMVIVYCMIRIFELRDREEHELGTVLVSPEAADHNPRWVQIENLMATGNPSSWREAIIEADIMLDDMLTKQGYEGATVGDKLKQIERSDFDTLNDAWEAHKVRNDIAHRGSSFDLSQVVANRTIARYEAVFREFGAL